MAKKRPARTGQKKKAAPATTRAPMCADASKARWRDARAAAANTPNGITALELRVTALEAIVAELAG